MSNKVKRSKKDRYYYDSSTDEESSSIDIKNYNKYTKFSTLRNLNNGYDDEGELVYDYKLSDSEENEKRDKNTLKEKKKSDSLRRSKSKIIKRQQIDLKPKKNSGSPTIGDKIREKKVFNRPMSVSLSNDLFNSPEFHEYKDLDELEEIKRKKKELQSKRLEKSQNSNGKIPKMSPLNLHSIPSSPRRRSNENSNNSPNTKKFTSNTSMNSPRNRDSPKYRFETNTTRVERSSPKASIESPRNMSEEARSLTPKEKVRPQKKKLIKVLRKNSMRMNKMKSDSLTNGTLKKKSKKKTVIKPKHFIGEEQGTDSVEKRILTRRTTDDNNSSSGSSSSSGKITEDDTSSPIIVQKKSTSLHEVIKIKKVEEVVINNNGKYLFSTFELPDKIVLRILTYLGPKDLCRCAQVSSYFLDLCDNELNWKSLTQRTYKDIPTYVSTIKLTWKATFQYLYQEKLKTENIDLSDKYSLPEDLGVHSHFDQELELTNSLRKAIMSFKSDYKDNNEFLENFGLLVTYVSKYPRIRLANPKLSIMGEGAMLILKTCGLVEKDGFLVKTIENEKIVEKSREILEIMGMEFETGVTMVAPLVSLETVLKSKHGANIEINTSPFPVGASDTIGRRDTMEDEIVIKDTLYAVFDGHGGKNAALMCSHVLDLVFKASFKEHSDINQVFQNCYEKLHQQIVSSRIRSGTTALIIYVDKESMKLWVSHVGDSRAVLYYNDGKVVRLTEDHKPNQNNEKKRIISEGGKITHRIFSKVYRVNDTLSITRALGDQEFQKYGVTHKPETSGPHPIGNVDFAILACDGLWDVISDKKACNLIRKENDPAVQATILKDFAFKKGSSDNISVVVVRFKKNL